MRERDAQKMYIRGGGGERGDQAGGQEGAASEGEEGDVEPDEGGKAPKRKKRVRSHAYSGLALYLPLLLLLRNTAQTITMSLTPSSTTPSSPSTSASSLPRPSNRGSTFPMARWPS